MQLLQPIPQYYASQINSDHMQSYIYTDCQLGWISDSCGRQMCVGDKLLVFLCDPKIVSQ